MLSRDRAVTEFLETGDGTFEDACTELLLLEAKKLLPVRGLSAKLARIDSASARRLTSSSPPVQIEDWLEEQLAQRTARRDELASQMSACGIDQPIDLSFSTHSLYHDDEDSEDRYAVTTADMVARTILTTRRRPTGSGTTL